MTSLRPRILLQFALKTPQPSPYVAWVDFPTNFTDPDDPILHPSLDDLEQNIVRQPRCDRQYYCGRGLGSVMCSGRRARDSCPLLQAG